MDDLEDRKALIEYRDRLATERAREAREASQNFRERVDSAAALAKLRMAEIAATGNIDAMRVDHTEIDPERRERDFADLVRNENVRLQSLQAELTMRSNDRERQHQQDINTKTREVMLEIVKLYILKELGLSQIETDKRLQEIWAENEAKKDFERFKAELERDMKNYTDADIAEALRRVRETR